MRSPTTCICSTSSSVISTPANRSSTASINSTRSSESAPRSFAKCVSLLTNSMSTRSCLATSVRTSLIEKHSFDGVSCRSGVELPMSMMKSPDSVRARNSVQINVPGSVTPIQKSWSVPSGPQRAGFGATRRRSQEHEPRIINARAIKRTSRDIRARLRTFDRRSNRMLLGRISMRPRASAVASSARSLFGLIQLPRK
jgi:hypothetical protein